MGIAETPQTAAPCAPHPTAVRGLGVSAISLALALWGLPAAAQSNAPTTGMSPAAANARSLLEGPRMAPPVTDDAGMGTGDPVPATRQALPNRTPAVPAAATVTPAATPPAATTPVVTTPAVTPPPARQAAASAVRGGIDSAGNGEPLPVAASAPHAPAPSATVQTAPTAPKPSATVQAAPAAPAPTGSAQTTLSAPNPEAAVQAAPAAPAPSTSAQATPSTPNPSATIQAAPAAPAPGAHAPSVPASAAPAINTATPSAQPSTGAPATGMAQPAVPADPVAAALALALADPQRVTSNKKEQEALTAFYGARQDAPLFVDNTGWNSRGRAVLARLAAAGEDGLDPNDYEVARLAKGADATALADAELRLALAALTYARHAQAGRFEPSRISGMITPTRDIPEPAAILATLADAADANAALAAFNPPHAGYKALKAKLATIGAPRPPTQVAIPRGSLLKPGGVDPRVPLLRARLGLAAIPGDLTYDPDLVTAVKDFQASLNLSPDGVVGSGTLSALNRGVDATGAGARDRILANMERWRWLPRDLGAYYVMVNIPEYMARIHEGDEVIHETRIVVGKPDTPTPLLSQDMRYAVVNPAWNIPPSIARNEMMPLLRSDPSALSRRGIQVTRSGSGGYSFRQVPGSNNALGRIKFMFPNDHSVYLHDTPSRSLFANERRAYSHGCMRVQDPLEFGEVLFNIGMPGETWSAARIGKMFGGSERYVTLKRRIPVHVVYFTAVVGPSGKLELREDLYGLDAAVEARLGLDGKRRLADGATTSRR
ncbi:L,D-transpeptidase family protein [Xanthobacter sp. ZOL 2024]